MKLRLSPPSVSARRSELDAALAVIVVSALAIVAVPHYAVPAAPAFVLLAAGAWFGPRRAASVASDRGVPGRMRRGAVARSTLSAPASDA